MAENLKDTYLNGMKVPPRNPEQANQVQVLLLEDESLYAKVIQGLLQRYRSAAFHVTWATNTAAAELFLAENKYDVILSDLTLPDSQHIDTVRRVRAAAPNTPMVVLTSVDNEETAMEALKAGAQDYLIKDADASLVVRAVRYAIERHRSQEKLVLAERSLKQAQMQLIQAEKMESVGRLAAGVAHEVKNPLAIIQMGIDLIDNNRNPVQSKEVLKDMTDAVERAYTIINGLLDFAAPTELARKEEDFNEVIHQAVHMVKHELTTRHQAVHLNLAPELPGLVIDRKTMLQVLVNVLTNASHAAPDQGSIWVKTQAKLLTTVGDGVGRRTSDYFQVGQQVVICEIEDDGPGIPQDIMHKIFDPFFTTKPQGKGTGLGLSVTKNIVELHGGRLQIGNRPEGGAKVTLTLVA